MQIREHLSYMIKVNKGAVRGFIDDINEDESMDRIDGRFNHIRWQAGHILYHAGRILSHLESGSDDHENIKTQFGPGSAISENRDDYPPLTEIKERLDDTYGKILNAIRKASDTDLQKDVGEGENKEPLWQSITFLCMHDFYHAGQIMYNRRGVGKKWPFG